MIGFNGGLIGKDRSTSASQSVPGVWTLREQLKAKRSSLWPPSASADPYYGNVSLLLYGNGTNGSTTIIDSSPSPKTVTAFGNAQISTAQSKFGGASIWLNPGQTNPLSVPHDSAFVLNNKDYTIEFWVYLSTNRTFNYVISKGGQSSREWAVAVGPTNIRFYWSVAGTGDSTILRSATLPLSTWMHIAVVKQGTTIYIFKDGVQQGATGTFTSHFNGGGTLWIGRFTDYTNISHDLNGYIDDVRLTEGVARYTSNFIPPGTDPYTVLLLKGNGTNGSTTIIDSSPSPKTVTAVGNAQISTAQSKFGGASIAFDGAGDYLIVPSTGTPGDFGTGDFTVELWTFLVSRVNTYPCLVGNYSTFGAGSFALFAGHGSAGTTKYQLALNGTGFPSINAGTIIYNAWAHIAVVRSGPTISLYLNGVSIGSVTSSANLTGTTGSLWIGSTGDNLTRGEINGYINDLRITKGFARYTSNFTPPGAL